MVKGKEEEKKNKRKSDFRCLMSLSAGASEIRPLRLILEFTVHWNETVHLSKVSSVTMCFPI